MYMQKLFCINQFLSDWCAATANTGPHDERREGGSKNNNSQPARRMKINGAMLNTGHLWKCPLALSLPSPLSFCCTNLTPQYARWHHSFPCPFPIYCSNLFLFHIIFIIHFAFTLFYFYFFIIHFHVCLTTSRCQWNCNRIGLQLQRIAHTSVKVHHPIFIHSYLKMRMHFHSHIPIGIGIR